MNTVKQLADEWMELFLKRAAPSTLKTRQFRAQLSVLDDRFKGLSDQEQHEYTCLLDKMIRKNLQRNL